MFSFIKKLFGGKPSQIEVEVKAEAPYKVEAPSFTAVGEPPATVVIPVAGLMLPVEGAGLVEVKPAPAKKPRAKKPAAEKKPRAKKAPKAE